MTKNIIQYLFRLGFYSPLAVFLIIFSPSQSILADGHSGLSDFFGVTCLKPKQAVCINITDFGAKPLTGRFLFIDADGLHLTQKTAILVRDQTVTLDCETRARPVTCDPRISSAGMVMIMEPEDSIYIGTPDKPLSQLLAFEVKIQGDHAKDAADMAEAAIIKPSVTGYDDGVPILLASTEADKTETAKTPDKLVAEARFWADRAKAEADRAEVAASKADHTRRYTEMAAVDAQVIKEKIEAGIDRPEAAADRAEAAAAKAEAILKEIEKMFKKSPTKK